MIKLTRENTQKAVAKCRQLKPRVKFIANRTFEVFSSNNSNKYQVRFDVKDGEKFGQCECKASKRGLVCYHLVAGATANIYRQTNAIYKITDNPACKNARGVVWIIDNQLGRRNLSLYAQGELRIARGKFSQLKVQAKENSGVRTDLFVNSQKGLIPINTTKELADELKTSDQTASRIIQIQAKADEPTQTLVEKTLRRRKSTKSDGITTKNFQSKV